ncbi:MAG: MFS transporter [Deltaproteobacteria bacterium]|nr:MAG: MFS transporter [Deltaproteobacteria bacterium]
MTKRPFWILPTIIFSQFTGTSLWFATNAILGDLQQQWAIGSDALGFMTSAVQLGFIVGTLCFAFLAISDRFSPRIVFFVCSLLGALSNLLIYLIAEGMVSLLVLRFITGFFLAGIYPVGMKIAAGWYKQGLGKALGFLVGALVVGTAFPHLLKGSGQSVLWQAVIISISAISLTGGILMLLLVPDGPYLFKGTRFNRKAFVVIFQTKELRSASFGYFGHMWELYTLWAFVPVILLSYITKNPKVSLNISGWAFWIIASGGLGCIAGGIISKKSGSASVAFIQLAFSGICCIISPLIFQSSTEIFLGFLVFWGIVVVGDSPQFSSLVAQTAPKELVGSALTIVNCIGFSITIVSIQLINYLSNYIPSNYIFLLLTIGPIMGLVSLWPLLQSDPN